MTTDSIETNLTIRDLEEMVGKKAAEVQVREREIVCVFSGGCNGDESPAGDIRWHIRKW